VGLSYKDAGVDIDAADALVERIKRRAEKKPQPGVVAGIGGFASLFSLKDALAAAGKAGMSDPLLVSGTDGVGTKLKLAFLTQKHDTVGIDLVAMCVNDVLTTGALPLFFLDYFGTGKLDVDVAEQVIAGIVRGCEEAGCALVGGETAELPGLYAEGEYDLAGFAVGAVDRDKVIDGRTVVPGDVVLGVESRGLHSNGYSLARRALLHDRPDAWKETPPGFQRTLGEELLVPTAIYTRTVAGLTAAVAVKALAHITGGGVAGNLPRVLPDGTRAVLTRSAWPLPPIFELIAARGGVARAEMEQTFNMGLGLCAVVSKADAPRALVAIEAAGERAHLIGEIVASKAGAAADVELS
jgi:phosphoribosylformylglycinamidine cyclo-ligase